MIAPDSVANSELCGHFDAQFFAHLGLVVTIKFNEMTNELQQPHIKIYRGATFRGVLNIDYEHAKTYDRNFFSIYHYVLLVQKCFLGAVSLPTVRKLKELKEVMAGINKALFKSLDFKTSSVFS